MSHYFPAAFSPVPMFSMGRYLVPSRSNLTSYCFFFRARRLCCCAAASCIVGVVVFVNVKSAAHHTSWDNTITKGMKVTDRKLQRTQNFNGFFYCHQNRNFFFNFWRTQVLFVGPLIPVLDFWWCLLWVSKSEWAAFFALAGGIPRDSPLVWYLPTSLQPTWQPAASPQACGELYVECLVHTEIAFNVWNIETKQNAWFGIHFHYHNSTFNTFFWEFSWFLTHFWISNLSRWSFNVNGFSSLESTSMQNKLVVKRKVNIAVE